MDLGGAEEALGRAIRNEVAIRAVPAARIEHVMFTISANAAPQALADDSATAAVEHPHTVIRVKNGIPGATIAEGQKGARTHLLVRAEGVATEIEVTPALRGCVHEVRTEKRQ
jgi:hypothetical protein